MIIHFVVDEKIIDQIIDNFLQVSPNHQFLVFTENKNDNFNHITYTGPFIRSFNYIEDDINEVLSNTKADAIILHQLNLKFANTVNKIKNSIQIAWIAWGFDVYSLPNIKPSLYAPITKQFILKCRPASSLVWSIKKYNFARVIFYRLKGKRDPYREIFKAIDRINFFSTYIREDFDYFSKYYHKNNLGFLESSFSTIDQYLAGNNNLRVDEFATSVIIGNSNTLESNYLDVIGKIQEKRDQINKIYCVLSYGKNNDHKKQVISEGEKQLGDKFQPLTDFMPREQYLEMLQSCSAGIFFHYRQQAMGNIIALLYLGSRVYLSERNPAYNFFLRNGIVVNSFENDFDRYLNTKLSYEDAENNRKKLDLIFSKEKVISDLKNLTLTLDSLNVNS